MFEKTFLTDRSPAPKTGGGSKCLFYKKYNDSAGKDKHRRAYTEIRDLAAVIPLYICLAEHRHTHQRDTDVDRRTPNVEYLQHRQHNDGKACENRYNSDDLMYQRNVFSVGFHIYTSATVSSSVDTALKLEGIYQLKYLLRSPSNALPCLASSRAIS